MNSKYLYTESALSEVTGLSRTVLKKYRVKGEWKQGKGKGRPVLLSQLAVDGVLEKFGIKDANLDKAKFGFGKKEAQAVIRPHGSTDDTSPAINQERKTLSDGTPIEVMVIGDPQSKFAIQLVHDLKLLTVSKLVPNNRILFAQNGSSEVFQVIVPSSAVWACGDPLRAKPSQSHKGYWELVGPAPRWRGDKIYRHTFV